MDHYNKRTIKKLLEQQPLMIVPVGDGQRVRTLGFTNVVEQNWWDNTRVSFEQDNRQFECNITAIPAHHWAGECSGGHDSSFVGYVIRGAEGGDILFAGDTARLHDRHIGMLRDHFNIRAAFMPGGPDELRYELESTHQAAIDALWMHMNLMIKRLYSTMQGASREEFLEAAKGYKTIYMHAKTFKMGCVHFDDIEQSLQRLKNGDYNLMKPYEQKVYRELQALASHMSFDGTPLTNDELLMLIDSSIITPKIGERTTLFDHV
jgi:L-ascorbate metabolism protein UlaG (beta-lactamase superfamily)